MNEMVETSHLMAGFLAMLTLVFIVFLLVSMLNKIKVAQLVEQCEELEAEIDYLQRKLLLENEIHKRLEKELVAKFGKHHFSEEDSPLIESENSKYVASRDPHDSNRFHFSVEDE